MSKWQKGLSALQGIANLIFSFISKGFLKETILTATSNQF